MEFLMITFFYMLNIIKLSCDIQNVYFIELSILYTLGFFYIVVFLLFFVILLHYATDLSSYNKL